MSAIVYDQHVHSRHSFDSRTDPQDNVRAAIERGLAGLTFAEHFDLHPQERVNCIYDQQAYSETIRSLRGQFGDGTFIGLGIEVGYNRQGMDEVLEFLALRRFDLVILSFHHLDDRPIDHDEAWARHDASSGTGRYLEGVLEGVRFCRDLHRRGGRVFDVLGHMDLVKRYTHRIFGTTVVDQHGDLIDRILTTCLEADLAVEINTSTLRQGLEESMPGTAVVKRYAALGGTAVSLGSDAHRAADVGADFDRAVEMLRDAGISHTTVFHQRQRTEIRL